jgi:hypothetical protein
MEHLLIPLRVKSLVIFSILFVSIILTSSVYSRGLFTDGFGTPSPSDGAFYNDTIALGLFADLVLERIDTIINNLEHSSEDEIFSKLPYLTNVSESYHGLPGDMENDKRQTLNNILRVNPDIASLYFVLPNGDIYLGEPYRHQEQLPRLNFADRDWYKGVSASNNTYVSSVFLSASINAPAIAIAVPVLKNNTDDDSSTINQDVRLGYLVGIVNLKSVKDLIDNVDPDKFGQFIVVDKNGTELISPGDNYINNTLKKFDYFERLIYNKTQLNFANQTFVTDLNNTLIFSNPISFKGGNLITILVTENR